MKLVQDFFHPQYRPQGCMMIAENSENPTIGLIDFEHRRTPGLSSDLPTSARILVGRGEVGIL